jgi:iron complex transport system ATP-binding protein
MILEAHNLNIGYGKEMVFPGISFKAAEGEFIALLGVNGIGKSTLLRTICGLQKTVSGNIAVAGTLLEKIPLAERAKLISVVLTEKILVENISVREFIALGRMPYTNWLGKLTEEDQKEINRIIEVLNIHKLQAKLFNHISDGERQKVLIGRALAQQTPLIILDEPTGFLDFRNKKEILDLLASISQKMRKTIILSTHDIESCIQYCSKCWLMTEDKKFAEIRKSENYRNEVLGLLMADSLKR